jgi:hypothetical protein
MSSASSHESRLIESKLPKTPTSIKISPTGRIPRAARKYNWINKKKLMTRWRMLAMVGPSRCIPRNMSDLLRMKSMNESSEWIDKKITRMIEPPS